MSGNVESGESSIYPMNMMNESLELKWSFIRKVYYITIFQLLLIIAVVSVVLFVHPVANFFNSKHGIVLYLVLIFVPLTTLRLPGHYYLNHPLGYFLLLFLNVSSALPVGLTCVFASGKISLEIVILSTTMMFFLTLYTFWAAKSDHDISLLFPFLYGSLSILTFLSFIQILFLPSGIPLEELLSHNVRCLVSIGFCGYIVCATDYIIKTFTYDQHIMAFVLMYVAVIITFFIPALIFGSGGFGAGLVLCVLVIAEFGWIKF